MEMDTATTSENLKGRSSANQSSIEALRMALTEESRQRTAVDAQQVKLIEAEKDERENAATERRVAHDRDVAAIKAGIETLAGELTKVKDKLGDTVVLTRVAVFLTSAIVVAIITGIATGHISFVVHP